MVADALNRKADSMGSLAFIPAVERPFAMVVQDLANKFMRLDILEPSRVVACVVSQPSLFEHIRNRQYDDPHLLTIKDTVLRGSAKEMTISDDGVLRLQGRICVSNVDGLREWILKKAHISWYFNHLGAGKMYRDLKQHYWSQRMKKEIVGYVAWLLGTDLVRDALEKVKLIQEKLLQHNLDIRVMLMGVFMEGKKFLLRILPIKGVMRFGKKEKFIPRYIGPFEVLKRVGEVAYGLAVDENLAYEEELMAILDRQDQKLRSKNIA
ncbi:uncharacterized protein [Nicotiana tomentosiformis]|uniref:uncharacterized protein n=1 Tax=Nicotiana tomentosiformis TaxID=4098 RepID=UPI00388C5E09